MKNKYQEVSFFLLKESLLEAFGDTFFNLREPGLTIRNIAHCMLSKIEFHENMESFIIYANYLAHLLYPVLKEKNVSSAEREKMFSKFYVSATDESTKRKWLSLLTSIDVTGGRHSFVLYHYIFTKFFHLSLAYRNKNIILEEPQLNLDLEEEETLRYVAGYILYCIIKAVDTRTTEGKCLKSIISCWS